MSIRLGPVGPRGLAVLGVTAVVGIALASHGWSTYHGAGAPGLLAGGTAAHAADTAAAHQRSSPAASASRAASASPASSPSGAVSSPGPTLASQWYAPYAYQVWPGTPSAAAQAAMSGLSVTAQQQAGGLLVTGGVNGQSGSPHLYPGGARVYVVEESMGDDSGNSDYNLGDDGIVVTDAQGRIVS